MKLLPASLVIPVVLVSACEPSSEPPPIGNGYNLVCSTDGDCGNGEECVSGVCQLAPCAGAPGSSVAPLGTSSFRYFYDERELVAADAENRGDDHVVSGYAPDDPSEAEVRTWSLGALPPVDVAGGNPFGTRPEVPITAVAGSSQLQVGDRRIDVGFAPVAVSAGDLDGDGTDEVLAVSDSLRVAVCRMASGACETRELAPVVAEFATVPAGGVGGVDITAGDIDGDLDSEIIAVAAGDDVAWLVQLSAQPDAGGLSDAPTTVYELRAGAIAADAGDIDGDGFDDVAVLHDGSLQGMMHVYKLTGDSAVAIAMNRVDDDAIDVAVGDSDVDDKAEVTVLAGSRDIERFAVDDSGTLVSTGESQLRDTDTAVAIATLDFDGDSPALSSLGAPQMLPGPVVPTMFLHFPPYSGEYSAGVSSIQVGDEQLSSDTVSDSISLSLGISIGYEASFFDIVTVGLSTKIGGTIARNHSVSKSYVVGTRYTIDADPELFGDSYGAVVLSGGCFHGYTYELDDPGQVLDGQGQFVMLVPVGGQSTVWSSDRYNALASLVGGLPIMETPEILGDPSSYPRQPVKPDGSPIPRDDLVFSGTPEFLVSDVGMVGWWMTAAEQETNALAMSANLGLSATLGAFGFQLGLESSLGFGAAYALSVGQNIVFSGNVPPIPDDPATPEDEYDEHAFAFQPLAYREHYIDAAGEPASYYVMSYAVAP